MRDKFGRPLSGERWTDAPLCGAENMGPAGLIRCTRERNHPGEHIAAIGPYVEGEATLGRWARDRVPGNDADDMAIDGQGHLLPYASKDVRAILAKMVEEGEILAVVVRDRTGDLGVSVFGPPSRELLDVLEQATTAYRRALQGH